METSHSEKLLGLIVNEEMSWKDHLYGEKWREEDNAPGLIPQLSQRVGLLCQLVKRLSARGFNSVSNGIFYSKLMYGLQVYGNVWGYHTLDENPRHFTAFTMQDCRRLQVLQNKVLKLQTGLPHDFPTKDLIQQTSELSIHQMIAYHTLLQVHKTIITGRPIYLANHLKIKRPQEGTIFPHRQSFTIETEKCKLNTSRAGFIFRGAQVFNLLPLELRSLRNHKKFKIDVEKWVKLHISIKPP